MRHLPIVCLALLAAGCGRGAPDPFQPSHHIPMDPAIAAGTIVGREDVQAVVPTTLWHIRLHDGTIASIAQQDDGSLVKGQTVTILDDGRQMRLAP